MKTLFISLYRYFKNRKAVFWTIFLSSFLVLGWLASRIRLEEDISRILPHDEKMDRFNEVFQHAKFLDKLVVFISSRDTNSAAQPDSLTAFADEWVNAIKKKDSLYIGSIQDRADEELALTLFSSIQEQLPLYLDEKDYRLIDSMTEPAALRQKLAANIRTLSSPAGPAMQRIIAKDPVGISQPGLRKLQQLQYDDNFELYDGYVMSRDRQHLLLFVTPAYPPANTGKNQILLRGMDEITDSLATKYPSIHAAYFGATAVSASNAAQLRKDTLFTQGITVAFLIVFIAFYFRKKRAPFLVLVPVVFGAVFSLAMMALVVGKISVIALGAGSVILGIAVNYALHVFNHYRHTRDMEQVIEDLAMPLTVGGLTTIGGFCCLIFVKSDMLHDLGLFAAFSLTGASLCSLIFLPHLIGSPASVSASPSITFSWVDRISRWRPEHHRWMVLAILLLTVFFATQAGKVKFETDMMRMNFMSEKLKTADSALNRINAYSLQSVYLISSGRSLDEALKANEKATALASSLKDKGVVSKYSGLGSFILSDSLQQERIKRWNNYWTPQKKKNLLDSLRVIGAALKYRPEAFEPFAAMLDKNYMPVTQEVNQPLRKAFFDDYITEHAGRTTVTTLVKVNPGEREELYKAFDSNVQTVAVDKQWLANNFAGIINSDFGSIALMSSILVFVVLLLTYGRIELTLVSFIPMFISWIWILGIMGLLGISFNIVNIIISALIFGLGDDYSLFIMDGLLQEYKTGKKNLDSYKSSIIISAITTIAGLGALIFADHPALRSIALIAIIGILCVVLIGQILIPWLFSFLITNRVARGRFPWTFFTLFKSAFAFFYFASGSVLVAFIGLVFVRLNPFNKEKGKLVYHTIIARFARSLMYVMPNVKKTILNPWREDFSKPAVVIANHSSSLDVLIAMMLHPKMVLFINRRVWNLPFVGWVVRMADFFPTTENTEEGLEKLADRVKQGYSVFIFPEATRSEDGKMKRFHKGAFFVAEKLRLDILPVLIHGTSYALSKDDFLLKDGRVTICLLPRITPENQDFGAGYAERTKKVTRYFKASFENLRQKLEGPAYYNEQLRYNYIYKGPVLEWYMRIKVRMEKNYQQFDELLPKSGQLLDIGCGYGFMAYMLHFVSPERCITGVDYDEEKIATAQHCFSKDERLEFTHADIMQHEMEDYDAITMMDILHYLQPEEQKMLINKCISHLKPGGMIIIRDGDKDLAKRHRGTRVTEIFSTGITGFNKTSASGLAFLSSSMVREIAANNSMECTVIDETVYTSNIIFVLKHVSTGA